jgi:hypothetical protein
MDMGRREGGEGASQAVKGLARERMMLMPAAVDCERAECSSAYSSNTTIARRIARERERGREAE